MQRERGDSMNAITFHLPIIPPTTTSQQKRLVMVSGKPKFFHNQKHQQAEGDLLSLMSQHKPEKPFANPIRVTVKLVYPWRKSETKKRREQVEVAHTSKPDCDNIVKLINDCMTKLQFWVDDSQISTLIVIKRWGDNVGITVNIEEEVNF